MPYFKHLSLHLPLFTSLPHPHILFAHHDTSPYHPPAASLISSCHYYSCIPLFHHTIHLSRGEDVDLIPHTSILHLCLSFSQFDLPQ